MTNQLRPLLGEPVKLGSLYDARKDVFLLSQIFPNSPTSLPKTTENAKSWWEIRENPSLKDKFSALSISSELAASYLCGLTSDVRGPAISWLSAAKAGRHSDEASAIYSVQTVYEALDLDAPSLADEVDADIFQGGSGATHVVVGIQFGSRTVITATRESPLPNADATSRSVLEAIRAAESNPNPVAVPNNGCQITVSSDVRGKDGKPVASKAQTFAETCEFLGVVQGSMKDRKGSRSTRIYCHLMSLASFAKVVGQTAELYDPRMDSGTLNDVVDVCEKMRSVKMDLTEFQEDVKKHEFCIPKEVVGSLSEKPPTATVAKETTSMQSQLSKALIAARAEGSSQQLTELLADLRKSLGRGGKLMAVVGNWVQKMAFADLVKRQGSSYQPESADIIKNEVAQNSSRDLYILHYNAAALSDPLWPETAAKWTAITEEKLASTCVDYDMSTQSLKRPRIDLWRGGQLFRADVVADDKELARLSLLRPLDENKIEKVSFTDAPEEKKAAVKLTCPAAGCDESVSRQWVCPKCKDLVSFNLVDDKLYCGCGRYNYSNAVFRCNDMKHGPAFVPYDSGLLAKLKTLKPYEQFNILILGETGIGKSTVVNMIMNVLLFDSLDAALEENELRYAISGSFKDRGTEISWGQPSSQEQKSEGGASATQKPVVHEFKLNGKLFRLIDTPGIADTRGMAKDAENIDMIMQTLAGIGNLSAILMLMDPSKARITVAWDWCLTELLTKLHRESRKNIIFGFTRAIATDWKIGDVAIPLLELLRKRKTNITVLDESNTFFWDANWFRYLAGVKGIKKEIYTKASCAESFQKCLEETRRLLNRTQQLPFHDVKDTLELNRVRLVVRDLVKPIVAQSAAILQSTNSIISKEGQLNKLIEEGKDLEGQLTRTDFETERTTLARPITVCTDNACRRSETVPNTSQSFTVYTSQCHVDCTIDTPDEQVGLSDLLRCEAFDDSKMCKLCKHSWNVHFHITYTVKIKQVIRENDDNVKKHIANGNLKGAAQEFIEKERLKLIALQQEDTTMQKALAKFSIFLQEESLVPMNDKTAEYLDNLISLASTADPPKPEEVKAYTDQKAGYLQQLAIFAETVKKNQDLKPDQASLQLIIEQLYALPYVGSQLKQLRPPDKQTTVRNVSTLVPLTPSGTTWYSWLNEVPRRG